MGAILKKKNVIILIGIVVIGVFFRTYNFSDWLHFELDQARDAMVVDLALKEGPGELPLLGPKAAGTFLRLGPAFYYFQYLGALVFGGTPQSMAYATLIFGTMTIVLAYLFMRRFFDRSISLGVAAIVACSHFLIMYSRFAWNPNTIPFFVLLTLYGLLRAVDQHEAKQTIWFIVSFAACAIATQMHFLVFMALPTAVVAFLVFKRPNLPWKAWVGAVLVFLFLYVPVIVNDIKTQGANTKEFFKAITEKSEKASDSDNTLADKIARSYIEVTNGTMLLASGREKTEMPKIKLLHKGDIASIGVGGGDRNNTLVGIAGMILIFALTIIVGVRFASERERIKKDFLLLVGLWFGVVFVMFIPLAFKLAPRFYLLLVPSTLFFLGISMETIGKIINKKYLAVIVISSFFICVNLIYLGERFSQLAKAQEQAIPDFADRILKERTRVTLAQQQEIADYVEEIYRTNNDPVYFNSESQYRRAILYHVAKRGIPYEDLRVTKVYRKGNYMLVFVSNNSLDSKVSKYTDKYDVIEKKQFGTLTLVRLAPKEESISAESQNVEPKKVERKVSAPGVPMRYTWNQIFEETGFSEEDNEDEEDESNK